MSRRARKNRNPRTASPARPGAWTGAADMAPAHGPAAEAGWMVEDSGVWGLRPQRRPFQGAIPTPEEIRRIFGPARTLGANLEVQGAADSQLAGAGVYSLIQHSFEAGLGLGATPFPGYPFLAGLTQNGLVSACVDTVAGEMTRTWIKLTRRGEITDRNGNGQDDTLDGLGDDLKKFKLQSVFHRAATLTGYYGGCLIFIDTGAAGADLKTPLDISDKSAELKPGGLRGFTVVEPISVFPGQYNTIDPLSPHYFRPSTWWIQNLEVHASRLIRVVSNEPPVILRPSYNFFGIPLAQILYDYVLHFQECRLAAQRLLTKFSLTILQTDMSSVLSGGPANILERRLAYFVQNRSNDGILAIDKEAENVLNLATPLSGVTEIVKQALELIACIAKVPAVKLLGISPNGFNPTGESDLRNYYDHVASQQEKILRPGLETALRVIQLNGPGEISPDIDFAFAALSRDDEKVQADIRKTRADTAAVYIQAGAVTSAEVRAALVQDPDSGFNNLDLEGGEAEMEGELAKIFPGLSPGPGSSDIAPVWGSPAATGRPVEIKAASAAKVAKVGRLAELWAKDWKEEDHPRDEGGQFGSGGGSGGEAKTTQEEKQKKIDSVKIDFDQDNTLPGLNTEDLERLGKEDKPVVLKKGVIDRNFERHPDIRPEEYNFLIGHALYNPDVIKPSKREDKPNYYNFIKHLDDTNSVVLIELSSGKEQHEIVHLVKMNDANAGKL